MTTEAKHTPGMLRADPDNWMMVRDETAHWLNGLVCQFNGKEKDEAIANRARMIACWNACNGIPTGQLEAGSVERLVKATELLLKTAQHFEKQASQGTGSRRGGSVWTKARAALAPFQKDNK